ncbi:zinc import ATP-binding protein ZnuC [Spirochaetota bacterium]|nr:zinc import ATP-binding protein ZnuC [Spirochaetota bacterium]
MATITRTAKKEVIGFKDVSFKYPSADTNTLTNITFTIYEGESIAIIGPNGGGKTTCLLLLIGHLKCPNGSIKIYNNTSFQTQFLINGVFQKSTFEHPTFPIVVKDFIALGGVELSRKTRNKRTLEALAAVKLETFQNHSISSLSAGQRQRMLIARALVNDPPILLFDEPTANLDEQSESLFYDILKNLRTQKKTIVFISHDISVAPQFSDRIFCCNHTIHEVAPHNLNDQTLKYLYNPELRPLNHSHYKPNK